MDSELAWITEQMGNTSLGDIDGPMPLSSKTTNHRKRRAPSGEIPSTSTGKIHRLEPDAAARLDSENLAVSRVFHETNNDFLSNLIRYFPQNSLASICKSFCNESYRAFRQSVPNSSFTRMWKSSSKSRGFQLSEFSEKWHYHPNLIEEIQAILTFATAEIVDSTQLPQKAVLGFPGTVCCITQNHGVHLVQEELCISSLFIPCSSHYYVKPFIIPVNYSNKDLTAAISTPIEMKSKVEQPLRAIFVLQYNTPSIFTDNFIPLERDIIVNGGLMSIARCTSTNRKYKEVPTDLAVGFSIFAGCSVTVNLYGIDINCQSHRDALFDRIKADLGDKKRGFCILLFSPNKCQVSNADTSWETDEVEMDDMSNYIPGENFNQNLKMLLNVFKSIFPYIPVIGGCTPDIMFNHKCTFPTNMNSSFLVLAY